MEILCNSCVLYKSFISKKEVNHNDWLLLIYQYNITLIKSFLYVINLYGKAQHLKELS